MTRATNRRAVLGAVVTSGALAVTMLPAASTTPALSAIDRRVVDLWDRRIKLKAISDQLIAEDDPLDEFGGRCDDAIGARFDAEADFYDYIGASVLALAAVLIFELEYQGHDDKRVPRRCRAALAALRPQLVGAIAEDADRALAQDGEERT